MGGSTVRQSRRDTQGQGQGYMVRITRIRSVTIKTVTRRTGFRWGGEPSEKWHNHRSVGLQAQREAWF